MCKDDDIEININYSSSFEKKLFYSEILGKAATSKLSSVTLILFTLLQKVAFPQCSLNYVAAYGSAKDISVYSQLGIKNNFIFIVGKTSKKLEKLCTVS